MSDPIGKIMTAYAQDLEGLTEKECAEAGFSKRQCTVLTQALGTGAAGAILEGEQDALARIGFTKEFIATLAGEDGYKALQNRVRWLADHALAKPSVPDPVNQTAAIIELQDIGGILDGNAVAVPVLIEALKDHSEDIRKEAALTLGAIRDTRALPALKDSLGDRSVAVRETVVRVLGKMTWDEVDQEQALLQALEMDPAPSVRFGAAHALGGATTNPDVIWAKGLLERLQQKRGPVLVRALSDREPSVRAEVTRALGNLSVASAAPALLRMIATDHSEEVREAAVDALGKLGSKDVRVLPVLIETLTGQDRRYPDLRYKAALALGELRDERAVPALIKGLQTDEHWDVREAAAKALGQIGTLAAIRILVPALKDQSPEVRGQAVQSLGAAIGRYSAVPALLTALKTETDAEVQTKIVGVLRMSYDPRAIPACIAAMKHRDAKVRSAAVIALESFQSAQVDVPALVAALPALVAALKDTDPDVRKAATSAFSTFRDVRAVPSLIAILTKSIPEDSGAAAAIRVRATQALSGTGDARVVPAVIPHLKDRRAEVRVKAAEVLGEIGDVRAVPALTAAMNDSDAVVRAVTAHALGGLEDARAVSALIAALKDSDSRVRRSAAWALGEINDARAVPALIEALRDPDADVQARAACGIGALKADGIDQTQFADAVPRLIEMLEDPGVAGINVCAAEALGRIEDPRAVPALLALLKIDNYKLQATVAEALGGFTDPQVVSVLANLLHAFKDTNMLDWGGGSRAIGDKVADVPLKAAPALARIGNKQAIQALLAAKKRALIEEDTIMDMVLKWAFEELKDPQGLREVMSACNDSDEKLRSGAREAVKWVVRGLWEGGLGELYVRGIERRLDTREGIDAMLSQFKTETKQALQGVAELSEVLKDEDVKVRIGALAILNGSETKQALSAVIEALKDSNENVVRLARVDLMAIKHAASVLILREALQDPHERVRYGIAIAAVHIAAEQGAGVDLRPLKEPLGAMAKKDPDAGCQAAAADALAAIDKVNY